MVTFLPNAIVTISAANQGFIKDEAVVTKPTGRDGTIKFPVLRAGSWLL